jgi:toxin-antitoxin system PIN domain toxin
MQMLLDTNVWLALMLTHHPFHDVARRYCDTQTPLLLCASVHVSLMRLLTTASIQQHYGMGTISNDGALTYLTQLRSNPRVLVIAEPIELLPGWMQLAAHTTPAPKRWMDAYVAAVAWHHGVALVTLDQGCASYRTAGVDVVILGETPQGSVTP